MVCIQLYFKAIPLSFNFISWFPFIIILYWTEDISETDNDDIEFIPLTRVNCLDINTADNGVVLILPQILPDQSNLVVVGGEDGDGGSRSIRESGLVVFHDGVDDAG